MPRQLVQVFSRHDTVHASQMDWAEIGNDELIAAAERDGFEVLLTADQNIRYQQNLARRRITMIVLSTNNCNQLREHADAVLTAIDRLELGTYFKVELPRSPLVRRLPPKQRR